jgi:hypothetical protein
MAIAHIASFLDIDPSDVGNDHYRTMPFTLDAAVDFIICGIAQNNGIASVTWDATWNGVSMTSAFNQNAPVTKLSCAGLYLAAPATGAHNLVLHADNWNADGIFGLSTYSGVDQASPTRDIDSMNDEVNNSHPQLTLTSVAGDMGWDAFAASNIAASPDSPQNQRWYDETFSSPGGGSDVVASGASLTMGWTLTTGRKVAYGAVTIKPAAGGLVLPRRYGLTGASTFGRG